MPNSILTLYDDINTTTTPLAANDAWLGAWSLIPADHVLTISIIADVHGLLYIEYANIPDVTQVIIDPELGYTIGDGFVERLVIQPVSRFYRIRYVNGAQDQAYFEVFPYFTRASLPPMVPYNKIVGRDENALAVRPSDPQDDILRQLRSGVSHLNRQGFRSDLDIADNDGWVNANNTTNTPVVLTTASTFTITYNNATDGFGTNGALSLFFTYLDENEDLQQVLHTLGNTGSDVTAFTGLGINEIAVGSSGSSNLNVNDITITATSNASVQSFVPAGTSLSQQVLIHIPRQTIGTVRFLRLNASKTQGGATPRVLFKVLVYSRESATIYEYFRHQVETDAENTALIADPVGRRLVARTVAYLTARTTHDDTNISASISVNLYKSI